MISHVIIPARLHSSRLKEKLLQPLGGQPLIVQTAKNIQNIIRNRSIKLIVACDSPKLLDICQKYQIDAILTSENLTSGTERVFEAAQTLNLAETDQILNVQGDEPFIQEADIWHLIESFDQLNKKTGNAYDIGTLFYRSQDLAVFHSPHHVKVVTGKDNQGIYFSRSPIPHFPEGQAIDCKIHIGIYLFRMASLKHYHSLPHSTLETTEKLEQLRAIENQMNVACFEATAATIGIDTLEDLKAAETMFQKKF